VMTITQDNITKFSWHPLISNPYLKKLIKKIIP